VEHRQTFCLVTLKVPSEEGYQRVRAELLATDTLSLHVVKDNWRVELD